MSQVVGECESDSGAAEVCAVAEASFDESQCRLTVLFESSLRSMDFDRYDQLFRAQWLPDREVIRRSASFDEAFDVAHELFRDWTLKVRESIPEIEHAVAI